MKKLIIMLLCGFILLSSACSSTPQSAASEDTSAKTSTTTAEIAEDTPKTGEMRDISSAELVKDMGIGWNLGNTLDVCAADRDGDGKVNEAPAEGEKVDETLWGNPKATKELFESLKEDGFGAVRIPITWRDHLDENNIIDPEWMDRVQEVVDYAVDSGLYAIINIHHDGGSDEKFGAWVGTAASDFDTFSERYVSVWEQICERFRDYSDYLVFESMNEVGFDGMSQKKAYGLLTEINQLFVDTVRKSGGNNEKRHLLIAGYWTDIESCCNSMFTMPEDPENRMILSVHYYTPWQFCTTNIQNEWGSDAEVSQMENLIGKLNTKFVEKGIPVIIGEYAASGNDKSSCVFFIEKLVKLCADYGIAPFYWDNGGQVDRTTYKWRTPEFLEAMQRAYNGGDYEVTKA
ncbi:MAG: glycoside hydrolase family 5 protein [Ruminiclostridium sp.]